MTVFASIWNTFPSGLFTSLTSAANTVVEFFGLDSSKIMPWIPKGGAVTVIPHCPVFSFWTSVKTLPAVGAPGGCQAGWAKGVCPQTGSQSWSRTDWSPSTSPCLVGSRRRHVVSSLCALFCAASQGRGERGWLGLEPGLAAIPTQG